jgi:hypothetical protein
MLPTGEEGEGPRLGAAEGSIVAGPLLQGAGVFIVAVQSTQEEPVCMQAVLIMPEEPT